MHFSHLYCYYCTIYCTENILNIAAIATVKNSLENFRNKQVEKKCIGLLNIEEGEGKKNADMLDRFDKKE